MVGSAGHRFFPLGGERVIYLGELVDKALKQELERQIKGELIEKKVDGLIKSEARLAMENSIGNQLREALKRHVEKKEFITFVVAEINKYQVEK